MKTQAWVVATLLGLATQASLAQELVENGDFETIAVDDAMMPILDAYGNPRPTDWSYSGDGMPPPDGLPKTELITNDSSGGGTNSAAMNPPPPEGWPLDQNPHSDWRSDKFATTPDETLEFSFDFKFLGVMTSPEFQQFRIELRSFTDENESLFVGEQTLFVSPVGYTLTGNPPVEQDFNDGGWHTLGFTRVIPSAAAGAPGDGNFADVRVSINAFTTLVEGQVRIDNVSVMRPIEGVPGDYNANGTVDAADYVLWRKYLNQSVTLPNDSTPAMVDDEDYGVWRTNFGNTSSPGVGAISAVPEPGACALLLAAVALAWRRNRRMR